MCQETIDPTDNASDPQPIAPQPQPTPTPSLQLSLCTSRFFSSSSPPSPTPRPAHSLPLTRAGAAAGGEGRAAAAPTPLLRGAPRPTVAAALSRAGRLGAPPPAAHGAARRAAAAAASTRAAAPTRAQPAAGGPGRRAALPNAIAGGRRPGPRHARTLGPAWGGGPGAEGAWPTCGPRRRAVWAAREPRCSGGEAAGVRKAQGNRCLTSADGINSRAAERGSPAAKSQEREREREPLAANRGRKAPARGEAAPPPRPRARGLRGLGQGLLSWGLSALLRGVGSAHTGLPLGPLLGPHKVCINLMTPGHLKSQATHQAGKANT